MNKHLPVLITLLTFGSFGVVGDSTVGATMTYGYYSEGEELQNALIEVNKLPIL